MRRTDSIRARFEDRHTFEEISRMFQIFIAELERKGAETVGYCSFYFSAFDSRGKRMTFPNEKGEVLKVMTFKHERTADPEGAALEITCSYATPRPFRRC